MARLVSYIERGQTAGAELLEDGRTVRIDGHERGFFVGPCLFDRVTPQMTIYTDEIFGPVLSVVRVRTYDEAVRLTNESRYANGAAIFTNDGGAARRFQNEVQAGMVGVNVPIPVPMASQRLALAQAPEAMASFAREVLTPILALGDDVEAALRATLGK